MTERRPLGQVVLLDDVGPPRRGRAATGAGAAAALLLPAAALLGGLVLVPLLLTMRASVTDVETEEFIGRAHFDAALAAPGTWAVVGRTLLWALLVPAVVTLLGYLLAAISRRLREGRLVRLVLVVPIAIPLVVTGVVFRLLYDPDPNRGLATLVIGYLLRRSPEEAPVLLGPGPMVTAALMSAFVWAWVGLAMLVFRAALDTVPSNLADAVRAHGGSRRDVFLDALWQPLLRRTVAVVFALVALGTVRTFDLILVMTPGSVRDDASVLALRIWETSGRGTSGPGAALGVLWLAAVLVGMLVAARGIRQPWPAPRSAPSRGAPDVPGPARAAATTPGRSTPDRPTPNEPIGADPTRRRWLRPLARLVAAVAVVVWLVPLVGLVATALHGQVEAARYGWWRGSPTGKTLTEVFRDPPLGDALLFTLLLAAVVTAVVLAVALVAAYPLARLSGPVAHLIGLLLIAAAIVPVPVIAGPANEVLGSIRAAGTTPGLALVHIAIGTPFAVLVLRNALADRLADHGNGRPGATGWLARWQLVRDSRNALVAVAVLQFVQVWNDLVVGLYFSAPDAKPLGLLLYEQTRQFVGSSATLSAASVVVSIPPVLLVVLTQRHIIRGLVSGGQR